MRRSSLTASRRSRTATSRALRRSSLGKLMVVSHDREVDVLQGRQLADLLPRFETGSPAQLGKVAHRERPAGGHDADVPGELLRLLHAVRADDQGGPVLL